MANISSQFKKASELYQRALQQYQAKEKEQLAIINQFKVGDVTIKSKLKPQLIALHKEMQHYQDLVDRAENAFERALVSEPIDLGEDTIVKNKKTGNVYSVKNANPAIHTKPSAKDIAHAKAEPKADGMATVNGIASTTGLRAQAVAGWADENGVNLSKVADDLKSKKLKPMDFMTAVVGNPGNKYAKQIISKYSQKSEALEQEVDEVTTNDWHFKKILQMWDKANPFGKKKIGTVLCRNPRANRNDIIAAMRDSDYKEITHFTDKLHIENVVVEDTGTEADESGMAKGQTKTAIEAATNIQQILDSKGDNFDVPAWVQSYLALASDYLQSINEYYKGNNEN